MRRVCVWTWAYFDFAGKYTRKSEQDFWKSKADGKTMIQPVIRDEAGVV